MIRTIFKRPVSMDDLMRASNEIAEAEEKYIKEKGLLDLDEKKITLKFYKDYPSEIGKDTLTPKLRDEYYEKNEKEFDAIASRKIDNQILRSDITSLARKYDLMRDSYRRDTRMVR